MSLFGKPKAGGFMDEIRCDEPSYLIWKWHPAGSVAENNNRENAIRWGSSLRVKDGEVAVFVYRQSDGTMQDFIVGPFDKKIETSNSPVLASIVGFAYAGGTPFQAEVYFINLANIVQVMSHIGDGLSITLKAPMNFGSITWPSSTVGNMLPAPKSTTGKFSYEHDDSFFVYVGETSKADYDQYVADCSANGFNIDYDKGDTYYRADNADGYHISLKYEGNNIMAVEIKASKNSDTGTSEPATTEPSTETTAPSESSSTETKPNDTELVDGMRKDFKDAMDSYEAFMDEYVAFMKKYSDNPSDVGLLADYTKYMSKYADMVEKFDKWESEDLNDAELAYYIDVQARVSKKLLEVAG